MRAVAWLAAAFLAAAALHAPSPEAQPPSHTSATLLALDGTPVEVSTARGHPLLIDFMDPDCIPCALQVHMLQQFQAMHGNDSMLSLQWGSVPGRPTDESLAVLGEFGAKRGVTWPSYLDGNWTLAVRHHVQGVPTLIIVDSQGREVQRWLGSGPDNSDLEHAWARASTPGFQS